MSVETTLTGTEIRARFLDFYASKGHKKMPSASLVPHNDPTVLLTTAGVQPMIPYFLGRETPPAVRMTSSQKCFRTTDIDIVGNQRTLTFFEMLGNFSVGDYFKHEAITYAWEFLTQVVNLPPERLYPTVHPDDPEAAQYWHEVGGYPDDAIVRLSDNWWGPPGASGPCGPDSEVYFDRGEEYGCGRADCKPGCDCERYLEIWNLVFTEFYQDLDGNRTPLARRNIDTGMGLERLTMVLQGKESVFDIDLFRTIIDHFAEITNSVYGKEPKRDTSLRVIGDHARALVFLASDGVLPSNEGRGYIFRRILRRAVRHGRLLGLDRPFLAEAADKVIDLMGDYFTDLKVNRERIKQVLSLEEKKFSQTLTTGLTLLHDLLADLKAQGKSVIPGKDVFKLYDTHGFPVELTSEIAAEQGFTIDNAGFEKEMQQQQERSRAGAGNTYSHTTDDLTILATVLGRVGPTDFLGYDGTTGEGKVLSIVVDGQEVESISAPQQATVILDRTPFYGESGGQIGDQGELKGNTGNFAVKDTQRPLKGLIAHYGELSEGHLSVGETVQAVVDEQRRLATMRNHSATHLLHRALRNLLGTQVQQRGSLVEPDRLRFDFSSPRPLNSEDLDTIDAAINQWIRDDAPVQTRIMPIQDAMKTGAMALFGEKYDDQVRVVSMGSSMELCGGTHCHSTGQIGSYVTVQETSIAAGIRRIEALTGQAAEEYLRQRRKMVDSIASTLQVQPDQVQSRVDQLLQELSAARKQITQYQRNEAAQQAQSLAQQAQEISDIAVVVARVNIDDAKVLREVADMVRAKLRRPGVVVLASDPGERIALQVNVDPALTKRGLHAGKIVKEIGSHIGGKGGGRPDVAQGGGKDKAALPTALDLVPSLIRANLR